MLSVAIATLLSTAAHAELAPVRIDAADARAMPRGAMTFDYGSFQWLWLSAAERSALSKQGISYTAVEGKDIRLSASVVDPSKSAGAPVLDQTNRGLFIVQFFAPQRQEWIDRLQSLGIQPLQYIPNNAVLVYGNVDQLDSARSAEFVRGAIPLSADLKRDLSLSFLNTRPGTLKVFFFNPGNPDAVTRAMSDAGAMVLRSAKAQPDGVFYTADVLATSDRIGALMALPHVVNVGFEGTPQLDDEQSNQIMTNSFTSPGVPALGYRNFLQNILGGLNGAGVTMAVVDTGADRDHPDLADAWVGGATQGCSPGNNGPGDDAADGGHGTHVAGAILGRGVGDGDGPAAEVDANGFLYGLGMAPATKLWSARVVCGGNTLSNAEVVKQAHLAQSSGSNNSWNNGAARSGYTASAREYDTLVRDANFDTPAVLDQFVVLFSAGNAGTAGLTAPHEAKNIISVGSSGSGRAGTNTETMVGSSSRGPAVDGRILPVITGVGGNTASTRNASGGSCASAIAGTGGLYALCNGTSMSTPRVAGATALTVQWWRRNNRGANPSPAMVKAVLVNGARDLPGSQPGSTTIIDGSRPIPNNDEGWGILNLRDTLATEVRGFYQDQSVVLSTVGDTRTTRVIAADANKPLRITLAWTDAPGAVNANPALVNNLDLRVTQGANVFLGNVFANSSSVTGGTADILANLENVYIATPGTGPIEVQVIATALNGDALSGNSTPGNPRQDYALVCSNCATAPSLSVPATATAVCAGAAIGSVPITVSGNAGLVQLSINNAPASLTAIAFTPNPVTATPAGATSNLSATLGAAAAGLINLTVRGVTPNFTTEIPMSLNVFAGIPSAITLSAPANNAIGIALLPAMTWSAAANAQRYRLEFSRVSDFSVLWGASDTANTTFTPARNLRQAAQYFWRVRSVSPCGNSTFASGAFTTVSDDILFSEGMGE